MITQFAPGKVMLAGEWAVLEPGTPCIVLPTIQGITATIKASTTITVDAFDVGLHGVPLSSSKKSFLFVRTAIEKTGAYLTQQGVRVCPFHLSITSTLVNSGLGSSAASVVATVKAMLQFHDIALHNDLVFKLAALAHVQTQNLVGSCFDVAAATYGCMLVYKRFDFKWLKDQLVAGITISKLVEQLWPGLYIEPLRLPAHLVIDVRFMGRAASTTQLVMQMQAFAKKNPVPYKKILDAIANVVTKLVYAIKKKEYADIILLLRQNRMLLRELGKLSGIVLETPEITTVCDDAERRGYAAKFSGAGGGDCVIVVSNTS